LKEENAVDKVFSLGFILVLAILVVVLITRLNRNQWRRVQEMQGKNSAFEPGIRNAIETEATVISKDETIAPNAGGFAKVDLQLEVHLSGIAPYQVSTSWLVKVDSLDQVLPGKQVPIKVNPKKVIRIYPNVPWATTWVFGK
jgi:hypothetical protein